jgi:hypothetical protein
VQQCFQSGASCGQTGVVEFRSGAGAAASLGLFGARAELPALGDGELHASAVVASGTSIVQADGDQQACRGTRLPILGPVAVDLIPAQGNEAGRFRVRSHIAPKKSPEPLPG